MDEKSGIVLYEEAKRMQLNPELLTPYGLITISDGTRRAFVFHTRTLFNSQLSAYLCTNKHTARIIFEKYDLPNIPFLYTQSRGEVEEFFTLHKPLIAKPLMGFYGKGVVKIKHEEELEGLDLNRFLFEQYIEGVEYRYLFLDDEILGVQRRTLQPTTENPWEKHRATLETTKWSHDLIAFTRTAANTLGLRFGAVDFLVDTAGNPYILEVNSAPSIWPFHHPDKGAPINVAKVILEKTLATANQQ